MKATKKQTESVIDEMDFTNSGVENDIDSAFEFIPNADKKFQREQALKAIKFQGLRRVKSSDLVGVKFDIINALRVKIKDDFAISFVVRPYDQDEDIVTTKSLNAYSEPFVQYFESFETGEQVEPMRGYTFVEIEGGTAGNKPITLRPINS